ncbi:MAG: (Fe-S)-binding protein [Anaerofustis sp.]
MSEHTESNPSRPTIRLEEVTALLPGFNCRECGFRDCADFAVNLTEEKTDATVCAFLTQDRFIEKRTALEELLRSRPVIKTTSEIVGIIDNYIADFLLDPLPGECSCREILFPFYQKPYAAGDLIRYRPLGCPIPHFARILESAKGLITVHLIGPCHRTEAGEGMEFEDVGVCMVGGFIGMVQGSRPKVGQTVRFVPNGCMMQKVHSGIIVQMEGSRAQIEGIDLKVWALPEEGMR